MDVRCPQCETLYELDATQLKSKVVTLKCSQCEHVFRFESRASVVQENQRRWMVRNLATGDVLYLNTFETLHKWIMEGKVSRDDEISRTGKRWMLLGDIGEFMPIFQVVDSISSIAGGASAEEEPVAEAATPVDRTGELPPSPHGEALERERVKTSIQYGGEPAKSEEVTKRARPERPVSTTPAPEPEPEPRPSEPARAAAASSRQRESSNPAVASHLEEDSQWEIGSGLQQEPSEPIEVPGSSGSKWPIFVVLLIALAGGGDYYVANFQPELLGVIDERSEREVVSIGDADAGETDASKVTEEARPAEAIANAYEAAFVALSQKEGTLFQAAVEATRPATDQALGVATEEAEAWAEGGAVDELLSQARRSLERGRQSRALGLYQDVLEQDKSNVIAITGIGWVYVEQSRSADAIAQFKRALQYNDDYGDAYIGLGTAERQRGNLKAAYDAYDLYLGRHPKGPKASIARYQMEQLRQQLGL